MWRKPLCHQFYIHYIDVASPRNVATTRYTEGCLIQWHWTFQHLTTRHGSILHTNIIFFSLRYNHVIARSGHWEKSRHSLKPIPTLNLEQEIQENEKVREIYFSQGYSIFTYFFANVCDIIHFLTSRKHVKPQTTKTFSRRLQPHIYYCRQECLRFGFNVIPS